MVPLFIVIGLVVLLVIVLAVAYNGLVRLNVRADEAWSDIAVQLKRRYDLIPNLVNTVKGYATHESEVFENVTKARTQALNAQGVVETAKAENQFSSTLKSLFAVSENYPQLRATENFQQLQAELVDTEDKVQAARRFYNGVVRDFNTKRTVFPTSLVASIFGFTKNKEFFEVEEGLRETIETPIEVKF